MARKIGGPIGPGIIGFILGIIATLLYQHYTVKPLQPPAAIEAPPTIEAPPVTEAPPAIEVPQQEAPPVGTLRQ